MSGSGFVLVSLNEDYITKTTEPLTRQREGKEEAVNHSKRSKKNYEVPVNEIIL
jgi:hypothetical protein